MNAKDTTMILSAAFGALLAVTQTGDAADAASKEGDYLTDFDSALKDAASSKRPVFALFAGSDWCTWCRALEKEVLSTGAFKKYAKDNLVLFVADFPREKKLPEALQKQNKELQENLNWWI